MSQESFIQYETDGAIATVILDRPDARNAQHPPFLEQFDAALRAAAGDSEIRVIVVRANGPHWSAGHDISPASAKLFKGVIDPSTGIQSHYAWEQTHYLEMTKSWRDLPKPTIAAVHGKCIAGGLMLCWPMDLIVASEDALFSDPVLRMGVGGVEYFAHPWELGARKAKEFLFTGEFIDAQEAWRLGMVNHVVPREELEAKAYEIAGKIAVMDPFGLRMAKQSVNRTLDQMGQWNAMQAVFDMHHLAHAQSRILNQGNSIKGQTVESMKAVS
jgi:enoyl-CoA hydratase